MLSQQTFSNPPSKFRLIPFWFWNSKMREEEVEAQIRDFHAKGLGGFFVHARFGLETEYLSREWMDCVKRAVRVAEELGMEVWLYDENGFPSGIGDLKVSRVREYRSKFIDLTEAEVESGGRIDLELPSGEVLMAHARPRGKAGGERIDLMQYVSGDRLAWQAPKGEWSVAVYSKCVLEDPNDIVYGVDYLNPEAMRYFFDITFEPYEKAVGEHFGKTIKGIFTDEPTLLPWHHNLCWYLLRKHPRVVVWDDLIESEMRSRMGMSAVEFLPHMFYEIDGSTADVRKAFWQSVADLYVRAFFLPYGKWCREHDLKFTGHVLFEEGLYINTSFQADFPELLTHFDIPGADHLGEATEGPYGGGSNLAGQLTNLQGEKFVASVSHYMGREAALSETYGGAGWGLSFEKMKWIADWQYSLGINMLCPHAVFYSIEGFRKSDAPPSENHMPAWKHYRKFADYIGRLSYAMREGRHVAKVALFYPLREFWGSYSVGREGKQDRAISDSFDLCASVLCRLHYDYDILSEQALASASVTDGKIKLRDEEFSVLIAPGSALQGKAKEVVDAFLAGGGTLIEAPTGDRDAVRKALAEALNAAIVPDARIAASDGSAMDDVRYVHRLADDQDIYFFINTSDKTATAHISLERTGLAEEWDAESGEVRPANGAQLIDGRLQLTHDFPPYGSAIYVVHEGRPVQSRPRVMPERDELMVLPDEWRFSVEGPNALILDSLSLDMDVRQGDYTYSTQFTCDHVPGELLLMLDDVEYRASLMGRMDLTVDVNGESSHRPAFGWYLDRGFKTLDIVRAVRKGENKVAVRIRHSPWSGQPHLLNSPPVLLGDFACREKTLTRPVEAARSGSWTEFGYRYYSGTAAYTQSFRLPKGTDGRRLVVCVDAVRDSVEIVVNGQSAGVRLWQPWEADITDLVKDGYNELAIKVTNSSANFLEGDARPSGLMGRVRLIAEGC